MIKFQNLNKIKNQSISWRIKFPKFAVWSLVVGVCLMLGAWNLVTPVFGQTILPLTVAPARQQLLVDPGEKTAVNIRFYNTGDTPVSGLLKVADFIVVGNEGKPTIIDNVNQASPKFSASSWFSLPYDRMTIPAQDKVAIQARINVPADARPGGRYVAIYFEPGGTIPQAIGAREEGGVAVASRIAGLVYLRVKGEAFEKALISRLFAPSFLEYGPINVETEIANRGDYHIRPRGVLTLSNVFGGLVDQQSLKEENIFPEASRIYNNSLGKKWMFGRYKIELTASYGEKGQVLNRFIYVWVFPWRVATVVVLTLIILILLGRRFYQRLIIKETKLEEEVEKERSEIEKLKEELRKKHE